MGEPSKVYFSPDLCAALAHPEVRARPRAVHDRLLVHHLYLYLEFTVRLETGPVNDVCLLMREPDFVGVRLHRCLHSNVKVAGCRRIP